MHLAQLTLCQYVAQAVFVSVAVYKLFVFVSLYNYHLMTAEMIHLVLDNNYTTYLNRKYLYKVDATRFFSVIA